MVGKKNHSDWKKWIRPRIFFTYLVLIFLTGSLNAGEKEQLFQEGNQLYRSGQYEEALDTYQKIIRMGYENGSLYYNVGNCYYKLKKTGEAILYYERAKRLMPGDEDVKINLELANLAVVDKIDRQPEFILTRIWDWMIHLLPVFFQLGVAGGLIVLFSIFLTLWILSRKPFLRSIGLRLACMSGAILLLILIILAGRVREMKNNVEGIILTDKVDVLSAPGGDGVEIFSLHEGTKVLIDQHSGGWIEIILPDRKTGWIHKNAIEVI